VPGKVQFIIFDVHILHSMENKLQPSTLENDVFQIISIATVFIIATFAFLQSTQDRSHYTLQHVVIDSLINSLPNSLFEGCWQDLSRKRWPSGS
jgi:low affinity Fe/Cu permease